MSVTCFLLTFAEQAEWGLRRYSSFHDRDVPLCPRDGGKWKTAHAATLILGRHPAVIITDNDGQVTIAIDNRASPVPWPADDDPRWPTHCECGFAFRDSDPHQRWTEMLYRRSDTGALTTLRTAPEGAMWNAPWYPWKGPDGLSLVVRCPGGAEWMIDGRANNCTLPNDDVHRCWIRHGEPPRITVDKNGLTCSAGAGSIQAGSYHGFLRDGRFT